MEINSELPCEFEEYVSPTFEASAKEFSNRKFFKTEPSWSYHTATEDLRNHYPRETLTSFDQYAREELQSQHNYLKSFEQHAHCPSNCKTELDESLIYQIETLKSQVNDLTADTQFEIQNLKEKCLSLNNQIHSLKKKHSKELKFYQSNCKLMEETYTRALTERDKTIKTLKGQLKEVRQEKENCIFEPQTARSIRRPFLVRTSTPKTERNRTPNSERLEDISAMIVELEKAEAEYEQKYNELVGSKDPAPFEIDRLAILLESNSSRLKEAKNLQMSLIKSSVNM